MTSVQMIFWAEKRTEKESAGTGTGKGASDSRE